MDEVFSYIDQAESRLSQALEALQVVGYIDDQCKLTLNSELDALSNQLLTIKSLVEI